MVIITNRAKVEIDNVLICIIDILHKKISKNAADKMKGVIICINKGKDL